MKFLKFGTDPSEVAYARGGELLPVPPQSLTSGGNGSTRIGGNLSSGVGQGIGFAIGLIGVGAAFTWMRQRPSHR